ncbi:MAG: hypothetical protein ABI051_18590 [Vicinamibacterales bacterium]
MHSRASFIAAIGVFLIVSAVYALANAGRIDIIDGQYRFEVAENLLHSSSLQVLDPFLADAVPGRAGNYSHYGIAGSITPLPLMAAASLGAQAARDREQFFFSFTSALLGAATSGVLVLFYDALGIPRRRAVAWAIVASFATLAFPSSTSVFDQSQHALFVLGAAYFAYQAQQRDSLVLASAAGCCVAVLVNFQETYALMAAGLGLVTFSSVRSGDWDRRGARRYVLFLFVAAMGLAVWVAFNEFRFGSLLYSGKGNNHPPVVGNALFGLLGLLLSPGKSLILYSPPVILAIAGMTKLLQLHRSLGRGVMAAIVLQTSLIATLTFWAGDWCWGPRYFTPVLPLIALGLPFAPSLFSRGTVRFLIVVGVAVQLLGISVDHHRFFYARSLGRYFWYVDPALYFRSSALFARPAELFDMITSDVPTEARTFRPGPYPSLVTYAVLGGGSGDGPAPEWMKHYQVFWLPRPWPFWMHRLPEDMRPISLPGGLLLVGAVGIAGGIILRAGLR